MSRRVAALDGERRAAIPFEKGVAVLPDDVGHFEPGRVMVWAVLPRCFEAIERALRRRQGDRRDVGVDRGGPQAAVPEQDLDRPEVGTRFEQVSREAVALMPSRHKRHNADSRIMPTGFAG